MMKNTFERRFNTTAQVICFISVILVGVGAGTASQNTNICLQVFGSYDAVNTAHSVTAGDFNEDGHTDIAVVAHRPKVPSQGLVVMLGNGTGAFTPFERLPVGDHNHGVITTDLDGDGHLDIVTNADQATNPTTVTNAEHVFFGDGTGRFPRHEVYKIDVNFGPLDAQAADVNKDGFLDLILAGAAQYSLGVMLNDGMGKFSAPTFWGQGMFSSRSSAIADFNRDGHLDVAVTKEYSGRVEVYYGDGRGRFPTSKTFSTDVGPRTVITADLDRDGNMDLAVTNRLSSTVSILFGDGRGNFARAISIKVGLDPRTIQAGDFNRDGYLDLAAVGSLSQTVSFLYGNGQRVFSTPHDMRVGDAPVRGRKFRPNKDSEQAGDGLVGLVACDVDANGDMDLVVSSTYDGKVYTLMNHCP